MPSRLPVAALIAGLALSACIPSTKQLDLREADLSLPQTFATADTDGPNLAQRTREQIFGDPKLLALIDTALANNQELLILEREIGIANAEVLARQGEYLPSLGIGVGADLEKVGLYTSQGASDEAHEIEEGRKVPVNLGNFDVGLRFAWEVDVSKKLRNARKSAKLRYLSSIEGRNHAITVLVAEIASSYYELMALDNQLEVIETNVSLLRDSLQAVKLQKQAGRGTELGVQRFEAELLENESRVFEIKQRIKETENRINGLCGRYAQAVPRSSAEFADLSPPPVGTGLPTELLQNRPDVRAAELELQASKLDVKVARAGFYPSVSVDGRLGYEAFALKRLPMTPESLVYDVAGGLVAPLLNRRAVKAEFLASNQEKMKAVLSYERTVVTAYNEVDTELARIRNLTRSAELKQQQVSRLEQAIDTSSNLFRSARADYLEVLTTRRDALKSKLELIETKKEQLGAGVELYRALGGGWRTPQAPAGGAQ